MKYGPGLLEKMDQEKLKDLISAEIESGADKDRFLPSTHCRERGNVIYQYYGSAWR